MLVMASGNCQDSELLADAKLLADSLKARVGEDLMDPEELNARFGPVASRSVEEIHAELDSAKVQYYSSEYFKAKAKVEDALREIGRLPVGESRWSLTIVAELLYALVLKQSHEPERANEAFARVLRLQPHFKLDPDYYSPRTIADFEKVRRSVEALPKAPLTVRSSPAGADVYLDGLKVGSTPFNGEYPIGSYQILVSKDGATSLSHPVEIKDAQDINIDLELESMLNTRDLFCVSNSGDERGWVNAAVKLGTLIGAEEVVVARLQRPSAGSSWFAASLVNSTSAGKTREAGLKIQGKGPPSEDFDGLADFIVTGKVVGALVVVDTGKDALAPWAPRAISADGETESAEVSKARPWRIASYTGWCVGGLALGTAGVLLFINQNDRRELKKYQRPDGSIIDSPIARDLVRSTDARRALATGLLVAAGIGIASGTVFHFIAKKKDNATVEIAARAESSGATLLLAGSF